MNMQRSARFFDAYLVEKKLTNWNGNEFSECARNWIRKGKPDRQKMQESTVDFRLLARQRH